MKTIQFLVAEQHIHINTSDELLSSTNSTRKNIINALNSNDLPKAKKQYERYLVEVKNFKKYNKDIGDLAELSMEYFYFQLTAEGQNQLDREKVLLKKAEKLPKLRNIWGNIKNDLVLATSALQLHIKYILSTRNHAVLEDLFKMESMVRQLAMIHSASKKYAKAMMSIITHLMIYRLNTTANTHEKISQLCSMFIRQIESHPKLLNLDTRVAVIYNCLKTLIGMKSIDKKTEEALFRLYEALPCKPVFKYQEHLLHLFFIIKGFIFRKGKAMEGDKDFVQSDFQEEAVIDQGVAEKLSIWTSVSLDQTSLALQEATRNIIRHRVASLATLISMKLSLPQFCLNFLDLMHDGPFNNENQTIKLCFELFEAKQYQKLNACLQVVLSSPSCKNLRERQVLLSMCGLYTGLFLRDREGALMYAKLNHHENKRHILREETLLQNVGFAYLQLATHQIYVCNRQVFQTQALHALKASTLINPKNYLTQYCLGKLLLRMGDLEGAYEHAKLSIMSDRGQWMPYSLLACVYFCQRRFTKAMTIIDQLLKKYKQVKTLYYIRAYLEANHILLEVQYDQEVEAAKQLGQNSYNLVRDMVLKNKSASELLRYMQAFYQVSMGVKVTHYDDTYFYNLPALNQEPGLHQTFAMGYQEAEGQQIIQQIIPIILQAGQTYFAQKLLKTLPASPVKLFQMGLLHETKGQIQKAIASYKLVLNQQPYHMQALINLSLLVDDNAEAINYIQIAEKISSDSKLWMAKGIVLSKIGRISQAHELFLKEKQTGWLQMQPDLTYYY